MPDLIFKEEVFAIVGAAMAVHGEKGCGFLEPVYHECLEIEFGERKIPAVSQKQLNIFYRGRQLQKIYVADFVAYDKIIVELKAQEKLATREEAQVINYLKATGLQVGVLINFGAASLEWKRIVLTNRAIESIDLQPKNNSRQFASIRVIRG